MSFSNVEAALRARRNALACPGIACLLSARGPAACIVIVLVSVLSVHVVLSPHPWPSEQQMLSISEMRGGMSEDLVEDVFDLLSELQKLFDVWRQLGLPGLSGEARLGSVHLYLRKRLLASLLKWKKLKFVVE